MKRVAVELAVLFAAILLYAAVGNRTEVKLYVVLPIGIAVAAHLAWSLSCGRKNLAELGLRTDNLPAASRSAFRIYAPAAAAIVAWFAASPADSPPGNFYLTLALYPFWGLIQQLVFQSLLHVHLVRLGLAPWSILITAVMFGAVHCHHPELALLAFPAGIVNSWLFLRRPNIIPLGVAHGLLGAMVYYLLLDKDPMAHLVRFVSG
jgi:hypothetical protein